MRLKMTWKKNGIEYYTIEEIKEANRKAGQHFFDADTLRFFSSRISDVYCGLGGVFFVTSEKKCFNDTTRVFTVRKFNSDNGHIDTVGNFGQLSRYLAHKRAKTLASKMEEV